MIRDSITFMYSQQRSKVTCMWKIIFVECRPVGGQRGVHRDPNAIAALRAAQFFSNTCQKMWGGKHVKMFFYIEDILSKQSCTGGGRKCSVSHPGVTIWWPIYISRSFSARPLRGWGPDSGRWGRFMKAVKLFSDPTKTKIYKPLALWSACVYAYLGRVGNADFLCVGSSA